MQDFMELFEEEDDWEGRFLNETKESQLPLYIYGKGEVAHRVVHSLKEKGITLDGCILDDEFCENDFDDGVVPLSEIPKIGKINVVAGFLDYKAAWKRLRAASEICHIGYLNRIYETQRIDREYVIQHKELFEETFLWLDDEASRETFIAYLNANITNDARYMFPVCQAHSEQYFFYWDKMKTEGLMTYIVCGAYDGDTIESIISRDKKAVSIFAFEPDPKNGEALNSRIRTRLFDYKKKIHVINKGVSSYAGRAYFDSIEDNVARGICRVAEEMQPKEKRVQIDLTMLDDELIGKIQHSAFITMDIEGSELAALQGAEKVIGTYKPHMAISVYHKMEDLISIPQKIKSIDPAYQFYMAAHCPWSEEVVLYAVYPQQ